MCFYGVLLFFVGKAWWSYRSTGGLKGDPNSEDYVNNILPEFLTESGKKVVGAVVKKADKLIDEADKEDKRRDEEAAAFNKESAAKKKKNK